MPVTQAIIALKDLEEAYAPFLLFMVQFKNGPAVYFTKANDSINNGVFYNGVIYLSAIERQRISNIGAQSSLGIDSVSQVGVDLADADGYWQSYENTYGFQGATLTSTLVFFDPTTRQFSTDSKLIFTGLCDPATSDAESQTLSVNAQSNNALNKVFLPPVPIQRTCPHWFPTNAAQRQAAANDIFSIYFACGYSPDVAGVNAAGNLQSTSTPYTFCSYDVSACKARGMFSTDNAGRSNFRFGGVQWDPPATFKGKSYITGKNTQGVNTANPTKWKELLPITFGTTWVSAIAADVLGDPNSTRGEFMFNSGWIDSGSGDAWTVGVQLVVLNGVLLPRSNQTKDFLFAWTGRTTGARTGSITQGVIYEGKGDPFGSIAMIICTVYAQVAASNSAPNVQVLCGPRVLPVWFSPVSYVLSRTDLLAWCLLEILRLLRPHIYSKIDMNSVVAYANDCAVQVSYTNLYGQAATHRRFGCSLAITQKVSGQEIVESLKIAGRLLIVPNANGSALKFVCKKTLCEQQPSPVAGSNYNSPVPSFRAFDNPATIPTGSGYVAYHFNESNYLRNSIKIFQDPAANTPIVVTANINDEDNDYIQDKVTVADVIANERIEQVVDATLPVVGLPNYDQAYRTIQTFMAERFRGNPRGDSGGTYRIQLETSFRALHLSMGDIVSFANGQRQIQFQTFRIENISNVDDFRRTQYVLRWHEDAWYTDRYGQDASPYSVTSLGDVTAIRPPRPWQPNTEANTGEDAFYGGPGRNDTYRTFVLKVGVEQLSDLSIVAELIIDGQAPINSPQNSLAPRLARQGNVATTGGNIPGGVTAFLYVSAVNGSGVEGPTNALPCTASVPVDSNTNSIAFTVLNWPSGTTGYNVYVGYSTQTSALVQSGSGTPTTITIVRYVLSSQGPPDGNLDHYVLRGKRVLSPGYGLLGPGLTTGVSQANAVAANTITFGYAFQFSTGRQFVPPDNALVGSYLIACFYAGGGRIPFLALKITGNSGLSVTVDAMGGSLLGIPGLNQTWFIATHRGAYDGVRTVYLTNNTAGVDTTPLVGMQMRIIGGTGANQPLRTVVAGHPTLSYIYLDAPLPNGFDATSAVIFEEPNWRINIDEPSFKTPNLTPVTYKANFDNASAQVWLTEVDASDRDGKEGADNLHPYRLFYWPGFSPDAAQYQGLNLLPNSDLAADAGPGEVVGGWYATQIGSPVFRVLMERAFIYSGKGSFRFNLNAGNYTLPASTGISGNVNHRATLPVAVSGENYFLRMAALCIPVTLPAGIDIAARCRVVVDYDDGTGEDGVAQVVFLSGVNMGPWNTATAALKISKIKKSIRLYVEIAAYLLNNTTAAIGGVLPGAQNVDIFIGGVYLVRVIDLGNEVIGNSLKGIVGQGSIIPAQSIGINVTTNSNNGSGSCTIVLSWATSVVKRSDQSTFTVPGGSFTWTGLAVATYIFYPRISADQDKTGLPLGTVNIATGNPPATPPTSPSADAAISTYYDGFFPQNLIAVTTPSNAGTGGGYDGGQDTCPEFNELLYEREKGVIKVGIVEVGDWIRGRDWASGLATYYQVTSKRIEPSSVWRIVRGKRISPTHPFSYPEKLQWQKPFRVGAVDTTQGIKVLLTVDVPHDRFDDANFDLVDENGEAMLVMHNSIVNPC